MSSDAPVLPPFVSAASDEDLRVLREQLGRPARGVLGIAARCACGRPTVVVTAPRLPDGTPFPTFFYLTHPAATAAMSALEATQVMPELAALLEDQEIGDDYRTAHTRYLADRESVAVVPEISDFSAGGMPTRVKCLHALAAHSLAVGPGVNPIGDRALERSTWSPDRCQCVLDDRGSGAGAADEDGATPSPSTGS